MDKEGGEEGQEGSGGEEGDKRRRLRGHAKTNSVSEKERKIGHRRINEEGQVITLALYKYLKFSVA